MADTLRSALLISAIGMGLVFGVILLLWGLIAFIVRVGADRPADEGGGGAEGGAGGASGEPGGRAPASGTVGAPGAERRLGDAKVKAAAAVAAVEAYLAVERRTE